MGNRKHHWSVEEEKALRDGVAKHGVGKWKIILTDPQFASSFINRSNVDLKDKWRNIASASTSSGANPKPNDTGFWYHQMIFEALSSTDNADGLDLNEIHSYIQERDIEDVIPEHVKRYLKRKLWKLVKQGKLEKNDERYKIKHYEQNINPDDDDDDDDDDGGNDEQQTEEETEEDAALDAAYKIAVAEKAEEEMMEAIRKRDKLQELLEESMTMLALAEEIYKKCKRDGVVYI